MITTHQQTVVEHNPTTTNMSNPGPLPQTAQGRSQDVPMVPTPTVHMTLPQVSPLPVPPLATNPCDGPTSQKTQPGGLIETCQEEHPLRLVFRQSPGHQHQPRSVRARPEKRRRAYRRASTIPPRRYDCAIVCLLADLARRSFRGNDRAPSTARHSRRRYANT